MSILMDALKQQTIPQPHTASAAPRRSLAPVIAALVALLIGFAAGYLVLQWRSPAPVLQSQGADMMPEVVMPAEPAAITEIFAEIMAVTEPEKTVEQEVFIPVPPVVTVTAGEPEQATPVGPVLQEVTVSDELRDKFELALQATERQPASGGIRSHNAPARDISALDAMLKRQIPPLRFDAHVYATEPAQRWVKVNDKTLQEGQWITADIRIREITPQYVLLEMGQQLFSVNALSEWSAP
ncbi:general secretion pathway protein GspB [Chromatiaceae bacterium AAb-1]|nr:general secretion pathway protein GspB [Chromatiaceae bacterium AAb-1]